MCQRAHAGTHPSCWHCHGDDGGGHGDHDDDDDDDDDDGVHDD